MRRYPVFLWWLVIGALAAALAGCGSASGSAGGGASGSKQTENVTFRLNWVIAGEHAPYYLAQQKGYWKQCGLNVSIAAGKGSGETAQLVANGSQDFGLTDAVSVASGRAQGLPLKSLGVVYQTNPSAFVSKKSEGITTIQDLNGKSFGAVPGGSPYLLAQGLFRKDHIKPSSEPSIPSPGIAQLKTGQVDFITFFGNEAPSIDPNWRKDLNVLYFKNYGQNIYGLTIATNDAYAAKHPAQVRCFRQGVVKGFQEAKAHPQEALNAMYAAVPTTKTEPGVQKQMLAGAFAYTGNHLLAQNAQRWEATERVLIAANIQKKLVPSSQIMYKPGGK